MGVGGWAGEWVWVGGRASERVSDSAYTVL